MNSSIESNNTSMNTRMGPIENRLSKIEGQLSVLLAGKKIEDIARYSKSDNVSKVFDSASAARTMLQEAANKRIPAPAEYFQESVNTLNAVDVKRDPGILKALQHVRISLAEYRSALQPEPKIDAKLKRITIGPGVFIPNTIDKRAWHKVNGNLRLPPNVNILSDGAVLNGSEIPEGTSLLNPQTDSIAVNNNTVIGLIITARRQVLDGIKWQNVTFTNTHIVYGRGDLYMDHVTFVNCTIEAPPTKNGTMLVNYVALGESSLSS